MANKESNWFCLVLPNPLMQLIRHCETVCVAGCCGLAAFDRDAAHMLPWLREHQNEFPLVLDQLSAEVRRLRENQDLVGSLQFNQCWDAGEAVAFLREWRGTILEAAQKVYGRVPVVAPEWRTETVVAVARQMFERREYGSSPILAAALQDAGCDDDDLRAHLRDTAAPRGFWAVDPILGIG
jgi:hypothetical protein